MDSAFTLSDDATLEEALTAASDAWQEKIRRLGKLAWPHPEVVAMLAEQIYEQRYKEDFEKRYWGQFVVVDVESEEAFVAPTPDQAYLQGLRASLTASLFIIRVGFETAFDFTTREGQDACCKWFS